MQRCFKNPFTIQRPCRAGIPPLPFAPWKAVAFILISMGLLLGQSARAGAVGAYSYRFPTQGVAGEDMAKTVIGRPRIHVVEEGETLLDLARHYGLGFNELEDLYPAQDPWLPPPGMKAVIPSQWVLPIYEGNGIVINIAELRLYYFMERIGMVKTFPIGIGDEGWETPLGVYRIGEKRVRPTWYIPPSLQEKYGRASIPPGPDNPLGDYWMRLGHSEYGIHGTNFPWSVGRLVTHGCIRLYPEHIENLFALAKLGTPVELVYEPVKIGYLSGRIYAEIHHDIYKKIDDLFLYGRNRLAELGLLRSVDWQTFQQAVHRRDGLPVDITARGHAFQKDQPHTSNGGDPCFNSLKRALKRRDSLLVPSFTSEKRKQTE